MSVSPLGAQKRAFSLVLSLLIIVLTIASIAYLALRPVVAQAPNILISAPSLLVASTQPTVTVPISLSNLSAETIVGLQVEVTYDAAVFSLVDENCDVTVDGLSFCNADTQGKAIFNLVNPVGIDTGEIAKLTFAIIDNAESQSTIGLSIDELLNASLTDIRSMAETIYGAVSIVDPSPTSTPTPVETATAVTTPTLAPTDTAIVSTATSVPTVSLEPTVTLEPTSTPEPTPTLEESGTPASGATSTVAPEFTNSPTTEPTVSVEPPLLSTPLPGTSPLPSTPTTLPTTLPTTVGIATAMPTSSPNSPAPASTPGETTFPEPTSQLQPSPTVLSTSMPVPTPNQILTTEPSSQNSFELSIYLPLSVHR